jgi:hypothetical protein
MNLLYEFFQQLQIIINEEYLPCIPYTTEDHMNFVDGEEGDYGYTDYYLSGQFLCRHTVFGGDDDSWSFSPFFRVHFAIPHLQKWTMDQINEFEFKDISTLNKERE